MQNAKKSHLFIQVAAAGLLLSATSCASLFGTVGNGCQCNNGKSCTCCVNGHCANTLAAAPADTAQQSSVDKAWLQDLLATDYSLKDYGPKEPQRMVWIDDTVHESAAELVPLMQSDYGNIMPRDVTMDDTENAIYFYLNQDGTGNPNLLHLRVQYYADDPLEFQQLQFLIDGFDYEYTPTNFKRGKGKGIMIWENSDDVLTAADKDLVYALSHAKWVQMKLIGKDGMKHVNMLSDDQIKDFYRVLQLYRLQGGRFE